MLQAEGVTKCFGGLTAVSKVSFEVNQGEIVGFLGPNGAGKTTMFNLISGALSLSSGSIKFKGQQIGGLAPNKICRMGIARTFQTVKVFNSMSVLQNVLLGSLFGKSSKVSAEDAAAEAMELLDFVGLSKERNIPARELTLVNQKRLELARALASKPEMLLLDEVMAGLNPSEVAQAIELVNYIRSKGITVIMIEHVMKAIMSVCDRIIVFHHGEKIAEGMPQEIVSNKMVIEVYLGEGEYAYAGS